MTSNSTSSNEMHHYPEKQKTWTELRDIIVQSRKVCASISKVPYSFTLSSSHESSLNARIYYLGAPPSSGENTLMYFDVCCENTTPDGIYCVGKSLLNSFVATPHQGQYTKEEQLQRERKRMVQFGITSYDCHNSSRTFVFPACSSLYVVSDSMPVSNEFTQLPVAHEVTKEGTAARLDPKLCPCNENILAYISDNDLWLTSLTSAQNVRLTFAHKGGCSLLQDPISAGVAPFIMQEEFDRFTGYWWQPTVSAENDKRTYRILYEEVDESDVDILKIVSSEGGDGVDEYRYPRAGTANARSCLKIVEFSLGSNGEVNNICHRQLNQPLMVMFPWAEYIVRAGWTPDGNYVHVQLMDRRQKRLELILLPLSSFKLCDNAAMLDCSNSCSTDERFWILCSEISDSWVNVADILHFFHEENQLSFVWSSERTGYRHLYYSKVLFDQDQVAGSLSSNVLQVLTSGFWEVDPKQAWVDEQKRYVYFVGYKDTPLETHLYSVHLDRPDIVTRLTDLGFSHSITMSPNCEMFVTVYSSVKIPHRTSVYAVSHAGSSISSRRVAVLLDNQPPSLESSTELTFSDPQLFEFQASSGHTLYGMYYEPNNRLPNVKYPVVLFVYGGPHVQLVSENYKAAKFIRLQLLAKLGYVVVVIDSRGSAHRGLQFESYLYQKMGTVELEDQIEGLEYISTQLDFMDMSRVAIHGWSYGGYLALMGLAQWSHVFKVAIAGAPVTCWKLYDTGYTERYMGLPNDNVTGYKLGSVLNYVNSFPKEPNRLLVAHGLIDENVHFYHTSALINALIRAGTPYSLLVYPKERHGLRSMEASEHFETSMLHFLQSYL